MSQPRGSIPRRISPEKAGPWTPDGCPARGSDHRAELREQAARLDRCGAQEVELRPLAPATYYAPVRKPTARIILVDFCAVVRASSCEACEPGEQVTETQVSHLGPRSYGVKCHDFFINALCSEHHIGWLHGKGHLPGLDAAQTKVLLWGNQVARLFGYYDRLLSPTQPWHALACTLLHLPDGAKELHLRALLDVLAEHLACRLRDEADARLTAALNETGRAI